MRNPEAFAFFFEETELHSLFLDWPEQMRLVACLDTSGGFSLVVYRAEEDDQIIKKISDTLGLPVGEFCLVPQMAGYPTKKILFSEERKLLSLVAGVEHLKELAEDYSINFTFAQDEGLDLELLMSGMRDDVSGSKLDAGDVAKVRPGQDLLTPPEPQMPLPVRRSPAVSPAPTTPTGYWQAGDGAFPNRRFADCEVSLLDDGSVCLVIGAGHGMEAQAINVAYVNDDLQSFALPTDPASMEADVEIALKVVLPARLFPPVLLARIGAVFQRGTAVYVDGVFYIKPGNSKPESLPPAPLAFGQSGPGKFSRTKTFLTGTLCGVAALSVFLLFLKMGTTPVLSGTELRNAYMDELQQDVFRLSENR